MTAKRRVGRPKAAVPSHLRKVTVMYAPAVFARIERAQKRRAALIPGADISLSDTIRALVEKALVAEEQAELQAEFPFTTPPELKTTKS